MFVRVTIMKKYNKDFFGAVGKVSVCGENGYQPEAIRLKRINTGFYGRSNCGC